MKLAKRVWVGIGVTAAVAVVVGVLAYMNLSSPRKRTVVVEPQRLNVDEAAARKALDERVAAIRAKGEPIAVLDFKPAPVDPKQDAAEAYLAAIKWLDKPEVEKHPVWEIDIEPSSMTAEQWQRVDAAVKEFAPALALIDEADGRTAVDWKIEFKSPAVGILLPRLNGARQSANLLHMAALSAHRAGRHDEAVHRITQMADLARHVDAGHPALVGHLVACGISRLAVTTIAEVAPTLAIAPPEAAAAAVTPVAASTAPAPAAAPASRERVKDLIALLLDDRTLRAHLRSTTLAERMFLLDSMECLIDGRLTMKELFGMMSGGGKDEVIPAPSRADLLADASEILDFNTKLVEASRAPRLPEFRKIAPPKPAQGRTVAPQGLLPTYDRAAATHYQTVTHLNLAAAALAVRWWAVDHAGALPPSLEALVPQYLPAAPIDPLAAAPATILYRPSPAPLVYSAGVDDRKRKPATAATKPAVNPDFAIRLAP